MGFGQQCKDQNSIQRFTCTNPRDLQHPCLASASANHAPLVFTKAGCCECRPDSRQILSNKLGILVPSRVFSLQSTSSTFQPQYRLATRQDVIQHVESLGEVMPSWETAYLADGWVGGLCFGGKVRCSCRTITTCQVTAHVAWPKGTLLQCCWHATHKVRGHFPVLCSTFIHCKLAIHPGLA